MNKLLTGQLIYETAQAIQRSLLTWSWDQLPSATQAYHNELAKQLNQELGLIESKKESLVRLPVPRPCEVENCNQQAHWTYKGVPLCAEDMRAMADMNSDNADVFNPALKEEKEHISYIVLYGNAHNVMTKSEPAPTIAALYDTLNTAITKECIYNIAVCRDDLEIGLGRYRFKQDQYEILSETGAAEGLNFALYDYAFQNV